MKSKFLIDAAEVECLFEFSKRTKIVGSIFDNGELFEKIRSFESREAFIVYGEDDISFSDPNYETLARILKMAYDQASAGKGKERHANGRKFDDQPIMTIAKDHGLGYQTGQAEKKLKEAHTLLKLKGKEAAIRELLGVINYAAAAIAHIEKMEEGETK